MGSLHQCEVAPIESKTSRVGGPRACGSSHQSGSVSCASTRLHQLVCETDRDDRGGRGRLRPAFYSSTTLHRLCVRRIGLAVPRLMVHHASLDLCPAPAQNCADSFVGRAGSAAGLIAACGLPRTYGRLWPAHRVSTRLHRFVDRTNWVGGTKAYGYSHQPGFVTATAPSCTDFIVNRAGSAEGLIAARGMPRAHGRLWPATAPARGCTDSWMDESGRRYQGLWFFTPAWICALHQPEAALTRLIRRAGSAEGLIAACGTPRTYSRLWPAHRISARLHRIVD